MLLRHLVIALLLLPSLAFAQVSFNAYRAGGSDSDIGEDVALDGAGNLYATGSFEGTASFGTLTLTAADDDPDNDWQDVYIVKYDVSGTALWARRAGTGVFNDFAEGIAVGPDGSVYVAGYFTGIATWDGGDNPDVVLTTRDDFDAFLAKYTTDGDLAWVAQAGGSGQDTGRGVSVTNDGDVLFAGDFEGVGLFGTGTTLTSAGSDDAFIARYSTDGELLWVRQGGGGDGDNAWGVATDLEGNAYAVGSFRGVGLWGGLPLQSRGASDLFVVKYDPGGAALWVQQVGSNGNDYGRGIAVPLGGWGVYVTGSFENTILVGQDLLESAGFSDVIIARLDAAGGDLVWGVRGGGNGFDIGNDLALAPITVDAPTYEVYTTGYVDGDGTFSRGDRSRAYASNGGTDGFVTVLRDRPGNTSPLPYALVRTLGGTNADRGYGVGTSDIGGTLAGVAVTGAFRDQATIGNETLTSAGSNDSYLARLIFRPPSAIEAEAVGSANAQTPAGPILALPVPNPFYDATTVAVALPAAQSGRVEVLDVLGRRIALLHDGPLDAGERVFRWEASVAPPGVYLVRLTTEEAVVIRRVTRAR